MVAAVEAFVFPRFNGAVGWGGYVYVAESTLAEHPSYWKENPRQQAAHPPKSAAQKVREMVRAKLSDSAMCGWVGLPMLCVAGSSESPIRSWKPTMIP